MGYDIDNDGYKEAISGADVVSFPLEGEKYRPFPGVIYFDLNEPGSLVDPQPLVWGKWGEKIASRDFSSLMPNPVRPDFIHREVGRIRCEGKTYSGLASANLDGDPANGDETLVINSRGVVGCENASIANYITVDSGEMTLNTLDIDPDSPNYPYMGCYARTLVVDGNRDGYDDIIVYGVYKNCEEGMGYGDIIYFQNTGAEISDRRFVYDEEHTKVLMKGQPSSWSLTMQQCDQDDELELVICVLNKLPYWEETEDSEAHVYYCNLYQVIDQK